jgi:hypothetical protein
MAAADYWVKATVDAEAEGPLSALEVKRRAAAEEITRDALISTDQATWHPAGRVKGLFPAPTADPIFPDVAPSAPPPPRPVRRGGLPPAYPGAAQSTFVRSQPHVPPTIAPPAPPIAAPPPEMSESPAPYKDDEPATETSSAPLPPRPLPPSLGYATPGVTGAANIRPRRTSGFLVVSILMFIVGVAHAYEIVTSFVSTRMGDADVLVMIGSCLAWLCLSIAAIVLWVIWLAGVHRDMQVITAGQYPVSPAKAAGFCFIPIFDAFWIVFAPAKLAGALNTQLAANGLPLVSRGLVVICQLFSVIAPFVGLYALTPVLYAISMRTIQSGFNRMAAH